MTRRIVVIAATAALSAQLLARQLRESPDADIEFFNGDADGLAVETGERTARLLDALDTVVVGSGPRRIDGLYELAPAIADCMAAPVAAEYNDYRRNSEAAQLRLDNRWREKRNRSMFNARVKQQRRAMKKARGIGRR
ncbi:hypothetical protein PQR05_29770 [Paraburkholderia sediminicola]|uniref:hypothetical protein n=1 Tax=Paraburkholderia sediminicola TaxID=458836 RepID=UPI0038B743FA